MSKQWIDLVAPDPEVVIGARRALSPVADLVAAIERAEVDAELSRRRFMMVDPANGLVADTLEADWNEKLRTLATMRNERERARTDDGLALDGALRECLVAMTTDFHVLWSDPSTPYRERKRMLACLVEDATLVKLLEAGTTKIHLRFRGGQTATHTTVNPRPSWQKVKTPSEVVELIAQMLDDHIYDDIAKTLNARGLRPGGSAWPGRDGSRRVQYIVHTSGLRLRRDRLRR